MTILASKLEDTIHGLRLICTVPDGIQITRTNYGWGMFATSSFEAGQLVYTGEFHEFVSDCDRQIRLVTNQGEFVIALESHAVCMTPLASCGRIWRVYSFDSLINHSCDGNTYITDVRLVSGGGSFQAHAVRNIRAGEELTSDYDTFVYHHPGLIAPCLCESSHCRGQLDGFAVLPIETKLRLLHRVDESVLWAWIGASPEVFYRQHVLPDGLQLSYTLPHSPHTPSHLVATTEDRLQPLCYYNGQSLTGTPRIVSTRSFAVDDIITSLPGPECVDCEKVTCVVVCFAQVACCVYYPYPEVQLGMIATGASGEGVHHDMTHKRRLYQGLVSFLNGSDEQEEPNAVLEWTSTTDLNMEERCDFVSIRACKSIHVGDRIICRSSCIRLDTLTDAARSSTARQLLTYN